MIEEKPTRELTGEALSKFVQPLNVGDPAPGSDLYDETGRRLNFDGDFLAGRYLVVIFVPCLSDGEAMHELEGFAAHFEEFESAGANIIAVSANCDQILNRKLKRRHGLPFPILGDAPGGAMASYGLKRDIDMPGPITTRTVVLTRIRQVRAILDAPALTGHGERALEMVRQAAAYEEEGLTAPHAPVLMIPNVLSKSECDGLIELFRNEGELAIHSQGLASSVTDRKIPVYEHDRQDRIDHVLKDKKFISVVDSKLQTKVFPMIKKAFAFEVNRRERLHIARYVGPRSGVLMGHRDDSTADVMHRRFGMSVSLNDDYEGGELVFKEFGTQGYRGQPGSALIFSASLLHEILETTKGVRYNLISHLFNDLALQGP